MPIWYWGFIHSFTSSSIFNGEAVFSNLCACHFSLKELPFRFTKLCKAPLSVIRRNGFTISAYLDDFLNCEQHYDTCANAICCTYNVLVSLGFVPNNNKSVYVPCQIIESLGHVLNSITMTVYLPQSKTEAILSICDQALKCKKLTIHFLCTVIGKLVSCFTAHPLGRLHYQSMERLKVLHLKETGGNFESSVLLDPLSISDLQWWLRTLPRAAAPINRGVLTSVFTCDASKRGWSTSFNGEKANGHFSILESPFSTNTKEILAVLYGLKSHCHHFQSQHILILSDSTTAISMIKSMGSMDNLVHDNIAQDVWRVAEQNKIWISMSHIPGRLNFESDRGSHLLSSSTEWELPQVIFDRMQSYFRSHGSIITDLFASRLNYKLKPYCSFGPDPDSMHVDCFTMLWDSPYIHFANPPFSMIPKTLQKIHQENCTVMMVFPFWEQQMWLNRLLKMLISEVLILPREPHIFLPWDPFTPHPLGDNLALCTAILSGDRSKQMDFQKSMQSTSLAPSPVNIKSLFCQGSANGNSLPWRGKLIPLTHLSLK